MIQFITDALSCNELNAHVCITHPWCSHDVVLVLAQMLLFMDIKEMHALVLGLDKLHRTSVNY